MTKTELETLTLVYALAERIEAKDEKTAALMCEHLLNVLSPLASPIATDIYPNAADRRAHGPEIRH